MAAYVYQTPAAAPEAWQAKCYTHGEGDLSSVESAWCGPYRQHTGTGLDQAFADRDQHNRVEHPQDGDF